MARPRKPTAALALAGAFDRNPKRGKAREHEPKPLGKVGEPPDRLSIEAATVWREMSREGFWLTSADEFLLEIAANYMARFRLAGTVVDEQVVLEPDSKIIAQLITILNKLGFSPADRSKINAPGAKDKDDGPKGFDKFK